MEIIYLARVHHKMILWFQGSFTDDRDVLVVKPEGGEIVHTDIYEDNNNSQISTGSYFISHRRFNRSHRNCFSWIQFVNKAT
jgi:hypothetical protein